MDEITKHFKAIPGYDCFEGCAHGSPDCKPGAGGFHGVASLKLFFAVSVPDRGAVSFKLFVPMYPSSVVQRGLSQAHFLSAVSPLGTVDLHYVDPPDYLKEWSTPMDCFLVGGKCYEDFTTMQAEKGYDLLLSGGETAVWSWLAEEFLPTVLTTQEA